jgi:hypothetical protein
MESSHFTIVEDGLVREADFKDLAKHVSGFAGGDGERDVKREYEGQCVEGISDGGNVVTRSRSRVGELLGGEVALTELVTQFEL